MGRASHEVRQRSKQKAVERNRNFIMDYLKTHPCIDCGYSNPLALEFDHLSDKRYDVLVAVKSAIALSTIAEEIAKCEVRCANCHKIATYTRCNSWRLALL